MKGTCLGHCEARSKSRCVGTVQSCNKCPYLKTDPLLLTTSAHNILAHPPAITGLAPKLYTFSLMWLIGAYAPEQNVRIIMRSVDQNQSVPSGVPRGTVGFPIDLQAASSHQSRCAVAGCIHKNADCEGRLAEACDCYAAMLCCVIFTNTLLCTHKQQI